MITCIQSIRTAATLRREEQCRWQPSMPAGHLRGADREANPLYPVPEVWDREDYQRLIETLIQAASVRSGRSWCAKNIGSYWKALCCYAAWGFFYILTPWLIIRYNITFLEKVVYRVRRKISGFSFIQERKQRKDREIVELYLARDESAMYHLHIQLQHRHCLSHCSIHQKPA